MIRLRYALLVFSSAVGLIAAILLFYANMAHASTAKSTIEYSVDVLEATDGDTLKIDGRPWIKFEELAERLSIRVDGVDTPEKGGRAKCEREAKNAEAASAFTKRMMIESGHKVTITGVRWDKFGGRFLAKVKLANGRDLSELLIERGYARPYNGEKKSDWCADRPS